MPKDVKMIRVVVASPSDVQGERDSVVYIVDELNKGLASERSLVFAVSRWEDDAFPGFHEKGPQALIDSILRIPDCDVFVGILWKRFGTPTGTVKSGTEHEYRLAYETWKCKGSPQIFFYFNEKPYAPKLREETDQWGLVLEFKRYFPKEGLWWPYKGIAGFRQLLRNHLQAFLHRSYPLNSNSSTAQWSSAGVFVAGQASTKHSAVGERGAVELAGEHDMSVIIGAADGTVATKEAASATHWRPEGSPASEAEYLRGLRVPDFKQKQCLKALDLLRIQQNINAVEADMGLIPTPFRLFCKGEMLKAADVNALTAPIVNIRDKLGLITEFKHYPIHAEMELRSLHLNELVNLINEALQRWLMLRPNADGS